MIISEEYDRQIKQVTKSLEHAIEMKWLTLNELIRLEAISHMIIGDLNEQQREYDKQKAIADAFSVLRDYMPDLFALVMQEVQKKNQEQKSV